MNSALCVYTVLPGPLMLDNVPEPLLVDNVISTKILCAVSSVSFYFLILLVFNVV